MHYLLLFFISFLFLLSSNVIAQRPIPNHRQLAWQEAELGAVFHYDLHVFDNERISWDTRITPIKDYQIFYPKYLDTDQWIAAIKEAGFTFALLTVTHETGFALYQSDVNPYCMKALKFRDGKGDIVREFVNSCRKFGIKPGVYIDVRWNVFYGVHNFKIQGEGNFRDNRQSWYNHMIEGMVKEICTNYGELFQIWFDGGAGDPEDGAPNVLPIVQELQPNCLFYHNKQLAEARWGGSESGIVGYPCWSSYPECYSWVGSTPEENLKWHKHGDPEGKYWVPAMADAPLRGYNGRHEWFWEPGDEAHIFPLDSLMRMYYTSVGRNATLIIGLTPDPDGLLPAPDVKRIKEWGDEISRRFSSPIKVTSGKGETLTINLNSKQKVNHVIIQENIRNGEIVRKYRVEGLVNGNWKLLCKGESIGNKRIEKFDVVICTKLRLIVEKSTDTPDFKAFSVFYVEPRSNEK